MRDAAKMNSALTDICRQLIDEWDFTPEQIASIAADIPGECAAMTDNRHIKRLERVQREYQQ